VIVGLLLLPALAFASWSGWLAWHGRWKIVAFVLGIPLALAALVAGLAISGALDSGHSEDWGPLLAMLAAAAVAQVVVAAGVISGVAALFGHRARKSRDMPL
jgi:hypothetical protein